MSTRSSSRLAAAAAEPEEPAKGQVQAHVQEPDQINTNIDATLDDQARYAEVMLAMDIDPIKFAEEHSAAENTAMFNLCKFLKFDQMLIYDQCAQMEVPSGDKSLRKVKMLGPFDQFTRKLKMFSPSGQCLRKFKMFPPVQNVPTVQPAPLPPLGVGGANHAQLNAVLAALQQQTATLQRAQELQTASNAQIMTSISYMADAMTSRQIESASQLKEEDDGYHEEKIDINNAV